MTDFMQIDRMQVRPEGLGFAGRFFPSAQARDEAEQPDLFAELGIDRV